jgi:hypothetical protein
MFNKITALIISTMVCLDFNVRKKLLSLKADTRGAEMVQVLIVILIVIIVGGIAVGILRVATPQLINDTIDKIRSVFSL